MRKSLLPILLWLVALPMMAVAQTPSPAPASRPSGRPAASAPAATGTALIDVNSASEATLDTLPGVGPARVKAIIANRPYAEKQELVSKKVLPANVLAGIQDKIALVNINTASAADMAKILPNVGAVRAGQIVSKRPYGATDELVSKGALTSSIYAGIKNLVTTGS